MNEKDIQDLLNEALNFHNDENDAEIYSINTFKDAGVLTTDKGIVLKMEDGSEFQITIVQSKRATKDENDEE